VSVQAYRYFYTSTRSKKGARNGERPGRSCNLANYIFFSEHLLVAASHVPPAFSQSAWVFAAVTSPGPANAGPVKASARAKTKMETNVFMGLLPYASTGALAERRLVAVVPRSRSKRAPAEASACYTRSMRAIFEIGIGFAIGIVGIGAILAWEHSCRPEGWARELSICAPWIRGPHAGNVKD
jgi:hypothetical protein